MGSETRILRSISEYSCFGFRKLETYFYFDDNISKIEEVTDFLVLSAKK